MYHSGNLTGITPGWVTVNVPTGTIPGGLDPDFGIVLNANGSGTAAFDTISLTTQSAAPVPIPPSVLLFGSGLFGLVMVNRKRFKKA